MTQDLVDGRCNFAAVLLGQLQVVAGFRICVGPAAYRGERDCTWMIALEVFLGVTCPITANLVPIAAKCGAVASVAGENRAHFIFWARYYKDWQIVIDWPAFRAPIGGEGR